MTSTRGCPPNVGRATLASRGTCHVENDFVTPIRVARSDDGDIIFNDIIRTRNNTGDDNILYIGINIRIDGYFVLLTARGPGTQEVYLYDGYISKNSAFYRI